MTNNDAVGTLRRSPNGQYLAFKRDEPSEYKWLVEPKMKIGATTHHQVAFGKVSQWPIVYTPPLAIGTIMRRECPLFGFEVAILTDAGWAVISGDGEPWDTTGEQPYDDEDGAWVVYGPVVDSRAS